ncbi:MAG: hypothetical protein LBF88_04320 [Planctomycetaceae bacterium]|jgi:hypothetical protein|nr:hypothetical protein [Planctomycetaceae bacterium]
MDSTLLSGIPVVFTTALEGMQPVDTTLLPGMPAPFWFVQFFKVVGFVLHLIPMGLWFAGLPVAVLCALGDCLHSQRYVQRMFGQFPIIMALGINFGIVPLLFLQTTYYKSFYTATVLMAWHWILVIPILIVGYYALYLAAFSCKNKDSNDCLCNKNNQRRHCKTVFYGMIASIGLITIGILISNGLTLMVRSDLWAGIMEQTNHYGATTGVANNMQDATLWIRLATMFGLGLITTGVWAAVDSHLLLRNNCSGQNSVQQSEESVSEEITSYRRWTILLSLILTVLGSILLTGTEWAVKTGNGGVNLAMAYPCFGWVVLLAYLVLVSFLFAGLIKRHSGKFVTVAVLFHLLTLSSFGIIRQIGQNAGVSLYVNVAEIPTNIQWSPLITFLIVFVAGLVVIAWMLRQTIVSVNRPNSES